MSQTTSTPTLSPQSFFSTTLSSSVTSSDTTIPLNALPTSSEGYLVLESTNSSTREIIHFTSKTGSAVVCGSTGDRGLFGTTAQSHSSGAAVEDNTVSGYWLDLQSGVAITNGVLTHAKFANTTEGQFGNNFVSSGYAVTGASGSLVATVASGVAYIAGTRVVAAVGGRTYQASSDTYVDLNSSGSFTYAGGTSGNSGASVALTASSIRIARVNTHGVGINRIDLGALASVNASISTMAFDPAGNIVYPKPNQRVLGYSQINTFFTMSSTTATQVPGLSITVAVPANQFIRVSAWTRSMLSGTSGDLAIMEIWDGLPVTGTLVSQAIVPNNAVNAETQAMCVFILPAGPAVTKTYNVSFRNGTGARSVRFSGDPTYPAFLMAEAL